MGMHMNAVQSNDLNEEKVLNYKATTNLATCRKAERNKKHESGAKPHRKRRRFSE